MHARWLEGSTLDAVIQWSALRRAEHLSEQARERARPWRTAAEHCQRAALELRSDERLSAALVLLREGTRLALGALCAARGDDTADAGQRERWTVIDRLEGNEQLPQGLTRVREVFEHTDALGLDQLRLADARSLRLDAEAVLAFLLAQAETRTPRQIRRSRVVRGALFALLVVFTLTALLAYIAALRSIAPHGG
jgi:hypothetical protein